MDFVFINVQYVFNFLFYTSKELKNYLLKKSKKKLFFIELFVIILKKSKKKSEIFLINLEF